MKQQKETELNKTNIWFKLLINNHPVYIINKHSSAGKHR